MVTQQEVCCHLAQILPRLKCLHAQQNKILKLLKKNLSHENKIVAANSIEALFILADEDDEIRDEIRRLIKSKMEAGSPSIKARGKKMLKKLKGL